MDDLLDVENISKEYQEESDKEYQLKSYFDNMPIIDGSECETNIDKCFDKFGHKYAKVKNGVVLRVYKKTLSGSDYDYRNRKEHLTSLLLLPETNVHLGKKWWATSEKKWG